MNFGSWNGQQMAEKLGNQWKHFWKTCTSRGTVLHCAPLPTIGASTTRYLSNHHPPLQQHPFRFYHIPNIPTSTFHSRTRPYLTNFTFSNRAGAALLNIIHKVPLFLYLGHHGDLHHRRHHRQHFTGPYTPTILLHLFIILTVHHLRMNQALWICQTPACNPTPRSAKRKEKNTDFVAMYEYLMLNIFFFMTLVFLFTAADYLLYFAAWAHRL
jgi:disulfide bond formation protein DsbB